MAIELEQVMREGGTENSAGSPPKLSDWHRKAKPNPWFELKNAKSSKQRDFWEAEIDAIVNRVSMRTSATNPVSMFRVRNNLNLLPKLEVASV